MSTPSPEDPEGGGLPPPGSRWGAGAQSVLPYLTRTLKAKPAHAPDPAEAPERDARVLTAARPVVTPRPT